MAMHRNPLVLGTGMVLHEKHMTRSGGPQRDAVRLRSYLAAPQVPRDARMDQSRRDPAWGACRNHVHVPQVDGMRQNAPGAS